MGPWGTFSPMEALDPLKPQTSAKRACCIIRPWQLKQQRKLHKTTTKMNEHINTYIPLSHYSSRWQQWHLSPCRDGQQAFGFIALLNLDLAYRLDFTGIYVYYTYMCGITYNLSPYQKNKTSYYCIIIIICYI